MASFADRLLAAIRAKGNPVCVGLDPRFDLLPSFLRNRMLRSHGSSTRAVATAFIEFNRAILDAVADVVPICKPQIAFYEEYGAEGLRAFEETVRHARERGLLVLSDVKRGDIGSTAEAYARGHLGRHGGGIAGHGIDADAVTVNPYLGRDSLAPFLAERERGKGVFILVRTSNAGAGDLQDLAAGGAQLFERVADMVRDLGGPAGPSGFNDVGAVVGATYPDEARRLRERMPHTIFLVPGYGAQGGTAADAAAGFDASGRGCIVSSSRDITFAYREPDWAAAHDEREFAAAAREAALRMADALAAALKR